MQSSWEARAAWALERGRKHWLRQRHLPIWSQGYTIREEARDLTFKNMEKVWKQEEREHSGETKFSGKLRMDC